MSKLKKSKRIDSQRGTVLIIALFVVALVATMSYSMMFRLTRDIDRTTLIVNNTQAEFYAQGALAWAKDVLTQNWQKQQTNQIIDATPIRSPRDVMNGYVIESTIYDMQSGYNINNVLIEEKQGELYLLLQAMLPDLSNDQRTRIARAIIDWIKPIGQENKFLTDYYLKLRPPYRPAHRFMISLSELQLIQGITPDIFKKLAPGLVALPITTQINIRFATIPAIMTLSPNMTLSSAKTLQDWLLHTKNITLESLQNLDIFKNNQISSDKITLVSQFFLLETKVTIGDQQLILYTLLERDVNNRQAIVRTIWQSKNLPT